MTAYFDRVNYRGATGPTLDLLVDVGLGGQTPTSPIRLDDAAAVVDALRGRFGINVADVGDRGALEARIDRLLTRQPGSDSS